MAIDTVIQSLRQLPDQVNAVLDGLPVERLRARPPSGGWSALEYLGHLRDLMAFHRWLIEEAMDHDCPILPPPDPDAAVETAGYREADPNELRPQFARRVDRLATLLSGLSPEALSRPLVLDRPIDVQLVARSALHEGYHHRGDLQRLLADP
jgi:hypothetical protein